MIDVVEALTTAQPVPVTRPTQIGGQRGWRVASHIIGTRVPMWCQAANLTVQNSPPVVDFGSLPAILDWLESIPILPAAIHLQPDVRSEGQALAAYTHLGPMRAIEVGLEHLQYPEEAKLRLCEVGFALEHLLPHLGALAVARHRQVVGEGPFDLSPWHEATQRFAAELG